MKKILLTLLTVIALASTSMVFAQNKGMRQGSGMGMGQGPGVDQERFINQAKGDPLARINKFLSDPNISNETKESILTEFKKFSEETFQLRLKHEEELYKWRKERMEKQHLSRLEKLKEQNALKNSLNYSSPESLKEFRDKMIKCNQDFRDTKDEEREEMKEKMDEMRDDFRKIMKTKANDFRKYTREMIKKSRAAK